MSDVPEIKNDNIRELINQYFTDKESLAESLQKIENWDVSRVTDMHELFKKFGKHEDLENLNISNWNVSNVENMSGMFQDCEDFNQSLETWGPRLTNVKDMSYMFDGCTSFNKSLNNWNVSKVENMSYMFSGCLNFNQPLKTWGPYLENVTNMSSMFQDCEDFNQSLNAWGPFLGNVKDMSDMFYQCEKFNQPLDRWGPYLRNVKDMTSMFEGCTSFNQYKSLINWIISRSTKRLNMFKDCKNLDKSNKQQKLANETRKRSSSSSQTDEKQTRKRSSEKDVEITANTILEKPILTKKNIEVQEYVINIMNNYNENSPVSNWDGYTRITDSLIEYYSKKYLKSCLTTLKVYWYDLKSKEPIYIKNVDDLYIEHKKSIDLCIGKIANCIKKKEKNVTIAIYFNIQIRNGGGHINLLIFKPYKNTLEWFEPYGSSSRFNKEDKIDKNNEIFLSYFIQCLQENETINTNEIKLVKPEDICPNFGFQAIEERSTLPELTTGYCVLWSLFMMKLALIFQHKTLREIRIEILKKYNSSNELRMLMYGFSNEISNILLKHFRVTLNECIENDELNLEFKDKHTSASSQYSKSHKTSSQRLKPHKKSPRSK